MPGPCILPRLLVASVLLLLALPAQAETDLLDLSGNLHSIRATEDGRALVHFVQDADGTTTTREVEGTGDAALDTDPRLALDPDGHSLALVWSREVSGNLEVALARFDDGLWSEPILLSSSAEDDLLPQVAFSRGGVALAVWMCYEGQVPTFYHRAVSRSLVPLVAATPLSAEPSLLDLDGQGSDTELLPPGSKHFLFLADFAGEKRLILFGVRDEPAPIPGRWVRMDFVMPVKASGLARHRAGWVDDRLLIHVETDQGLLYTQQLSASTWTEYRQLSQPDLSMEASELLIIQQMLTPETQD